MQKAVIYHNPRCRKSRETLNILNEKSVEVEVIEYLKAPPSKKDLELIVELLDIKPEELIRKTEKIFKEQYKGKSLTAEDWLQVMVDNPILMERPIVICNNKAVIGRPPEKVLDII